MELIDGLTLRELIDSQGALPVSEAVDITMQVAAALTHAHEHELVHRDVKPGNVLVQRDGHVKVTDFGIAKATDGGSELTRAGSGDGHRALPRAGAAARRYGRRARRRLLARTGPLRDARRPTAVRSRLRRRDRGRAAYVTTQPDQPRVPPHLARARSSSSTARSPARPRGTVAERARIPRRARAVPHRWPPGTGGPDHPGPPPSPPRGRRARRPHHGRRPGGRRSTSGRRLDQCRVPAPPAVRSPRPACSSGHPCS